MADMEGTASAAGAADATTNYEIMVRDDWQKFSDENKSKLRPNIMLLGATGCGKSSLINTIFGSHVAAVNDASRGTEGFHTYYGADYGLGVNLIDSFGYELSQNAGTDSGYTSFEGYERSIENKLRTNHAADALGKIHLAWYCISVAAGRIQEYDIKVLDMLEKDPDLRSRVAVVLTKCDQDDENGSTAQTFRELIAKDVSEKMPVFEVSNDPALRLDLEKLIEWSTEQLDSQDLKEAFVSSQLIDLGQKKKTAEDKIKWYAAGAAGVGAIPIPISDAAILTPMQVTMATHVISIYGLQNFGTISSALIGDVLVSNLGKAFARGLLKLLPGGAIVGSVINAGVASSITYALGTAISNICYETSARMVRGEPVDLKSLFNADEIKAFVQGYMKLNKKS